jgi:hypothetical protein
MFRCDKCNREFSSKQSLQRHGARLLPCKPVTAGAKKYCCKYCSQEFNHASNRCSHQHICKQKPQEGESSTSSITVPSAKPVAPILSEKDKKELNELMDELKLTRQQVEDRLRNPGGITNHITNNINQTNIFNINNFGSEDCSRITENILHNCFLDRKKGISTLIKFVHFNDDFPSDKNIRKGSITRKTLQIMQDGAWTHANKNIVLDKVIVDKARLINGYFQSNYFSFDHITREPYENWFDKMREKRGEDFYNLRNEIYLLANEIKVQ